MHFMYSAYLVDNYILKMWSFNNIKKNNSVFKNPWIVGDIYTEELVNQ